MPDGAGLFVLTSDDELELFSRTRGRAFAEQRVDGNQTVAGEEPGILGTPCAPRWTIPRDDATAELMTTFYREMFQYGRPPAAALRAAQLSLLRSRRWRAPSYWAGFRIQGDWR